MQNWSQYALSILVVLLSLGAVLWWMRRTGLRRNFTGLGQRIQIRESLSLGIRHKLVLVQVDNQNLLLNVSPNEVKTLHAWSDVASPKHHDPSTLAP